MMMMMRRMANRIDIDYQLIVPADFDLGAIDTAIAVEVQVEHQHRCYSTVEVLRERYCC
jgi:hypothetical protein